MIQLLVLSWDFSVSSLTTLWICSFTNLLGSWSLSSFNSNLTSESEVRFGMLSLRVHASNTCLLKMSLLSA